MPDTSFNSLNLPQTVLKGITDAGFTEMSPIQRQAMPIALSGKDLCAQAQTGTGKTAAFLISLFSEILRGDGIRANDPRPQALILAPTRELAMQIYREGVLLGSHTGLRMAAVYGGEGFARQEKKLRTGLDLVVGTPGRLLDFLRRKILDLGGVRYLVIDEADRLLDLGFWDELKHILRRLPPVKSRQSMLFSATLDGSTRKIVSGYMNHPVNIAIHPERIAAKGIDQTVYHVDQDFKFRLLLGILAREEIPKGLIFTNMKITAAWVAKKLEENGFGKVGLLTGDMRQPMRNRVLERFKEGKVPLLVASDVASRGLHIDDVTHIINYDVPQDPEDYVHRIGRTARAGKKGKAYTLACDRYCWSLPDIEKLLTHPLPYQVPYEKDYGVDRTPEFTIRKMIREEGRKKRKPAGEHSTGKRGSTNRRRSRSGR